MDAGEYSFYTKLFLKKNLTYLDAVNEIKLFWSAKRDKEYVKRVGSKQIEIETIEEIIRTFHRFNHIDWAWKQIEQLEKFPNAKIKVNLLKAWLYDTEKKYYEALQHYKQAYMAQPYIDLLEKLADCSIKDGQYEVAEKYISQYEKEKSEKLKKDSRQGLFDLSHKQYIDGVTSNLRYKLEQAKKGRDIEL